MWREKKTYYFIHIVHIQPKRFSHVTVDCIGLDEQQADLLQLVKRDQVMEAVRLVGEIGKKWHVTID